MKQKIRIRTTATVEPQARVYTWPDVKEMLDQQRADLVKVFEGKAAILAEADVLDQLKTLTIIYLSCLADMGLQKIGMEDFLVRVAEYSDKLNNGSEDYLQMEERIEKILGYKLTDKEAMEDLKRRIMQ